MNNHKYFLGSNVKAGNAHSLNFLKGVNPKYAEHMYNRNRIVEAFALSEYGNVDVLEQPMCGKCEQPGWHTTGKLPVMVKVKDEFGDEQDKFIYNCYCPKCGAVTENTLTLKEYLMQELKLPANDIKHMERLIYGEGSIL